MNAYSQLSVAELNCLASMYAGIVKERGVIEFGIGFLVFYNPDAISSAIALDRLAAISAEVKRRDELKTAATPETGE